MRVREAIAASGVLLLCASCFIVFSVSRRATLLSEPGALAIPASEVGDGCVFLFAILSAPKNRFWRQFMRDTWLKALPSDKRWCYKYFLGNHTTASLIREQTRFQDLVFLPIDEGYNLLSLKTNAIADWVRCP